MEIFEIEIEVSFRHSESRKVNKNNLEGSYQSLEKEKVGNTSCSKSVDNQNCFLILFPKNNMMNTELLFVSYSIIFVGYTNSFQ